ncbi:MAG: HU family DNA-binding protein [Parabacteroides sp.]
MSLKYSIVKRKDMSANAPADARLFYGQTRAANKISFNKLCEAVASHRTASRGDVMLVIDGLIHVMIDRLSEGDVLKLDGFGSFQLIAGSKGSSTAETFNTSLFKRARIVFRPGVLLRELTNNVKYEKLQTTTVTVTEDCDKEHVY